MNGWLVVSIVLCIICLAEAIHMGIVKREMRRARRELELTREKGYNRQITVTLLNRDLEALVAAMNRNLDYQKQLKYEAEQSEKRLRQSVSDIAHDLRTPLTVIKGNLQMMEQKGNVPEDTTGYLRTCQKKCDTLKDMVDEFFEMSVLESDSGSAELMQVNITNLLMQFIVDHEAVIREKGLVPDINLPEKSVIIHADPQMVTRMLSNLLGNVLKYAKDSFGIRVDIIDEKDSSHLRIAFENRIMQGDEPDVAHLFDRTYQGNRARTASGAGLGLYIVKLLADKQGAEVFAVTKDKVLSVGIIFPMLR